MVRVILRWLVPAATTTSVPQYRSLVVADSPEYTPIEQLGVLTGQAIETFNPSFAANAEIFPRGQRSHELPLIFWRNYRDYAEAEEAKFKWINELPPPTVRFDTIVHAAVGTGFTYGVRLMRCAIRNARAAEQVGKALKWELDIVGSQIEAPSTISYPTGTALLP